MKEQEFWQMIDQSLEESNGDGEVQLEMLNEKLLMLEPDQIIEFENIFNQFYRMSYRADLWGAAFIINGGASDDGFDYFRGWLITQGQTIFEAALEHPDSLADVVDPESAFGFENEDILYLPSRCWSQKTGLDADEFYKQRGKPEPMPALGEFEWSDGGDIDERKGKRLYPKLWKKFDWGE